MFTFKKIVNQIKVELKKKDMRYCQGKGINSYQIRKEKRAMRGIKSFNYFQFK